MAYRPAAIKQHLSPETFEFPLAEIRRGYRSAIYFNRTKIIAEDFQLKNPHVTMQVFQKNTGVLCGASESIALLKSCVGHWSNRDKAYQVFDAYMEAKLAVRRNPLNVNARGNLMETEQTLESLWVNTWGDLTVSSLYDGDIIFPWEPIMHIDGPYSEFAHLESVYLGIFARGTKVASNVSRVVAAAGDLPIYFFADRFDRWENQGSDGYAAYLGGAEGVASDAMAAWWGDHGMGTMPHALIAACDGDVSLATSIFHQAFPDMNLVALVDYNNDCVTDSIITAEENRSLYAVRLDTSETLVDESINADTPGYGQHKPTGVNPMLVANVREALDHHGFPEVKILVSGGFNEDKIKEFKRRTVPVDGFCVGSSLLQGSNDFTADIVRPSGKVGRPYRESQYLELVE